jgi:hypothetical protein
MVRRSRSRPTGDRRHPHNRRPGRAGPSGLYTPMSAIDTLVHAGLDGIREIHPKHCESVRHYQRMIKELGLWNRGSDFTERAGGIDGRIWPVPLVLDEAASRWTRLGSSMRRWRFASASRHRGRLSYLLQRFRPQRVYYLTVDSCRPRRRRGRCARCRRRRPGSIEKDGRAVTLTSCRGQIEGRPSLP